MRTYVGGIQCCGHGMILLDADQEVPPAVDEVRMLYAPCVPCVPRIPRIPCMHTGAYSYVLTEVLQGREGHPY